MHDSFGRCSRIILRHDHRRGLALPAQNGMNPLILNPPTYGRRRASCVEGETMLWRRADLEAADGIGALGAEIAENVASIRIVRAAII
jgi:glycosyl transferase family 21